MLGSDDGRGSDDGCALGVLLGSDDGGALGVLDDTVADVFSSFRMYRATSKSNDAVPNEREATTGVGASMYDPVSVPTSCSVPL